MDKIRLVKIDDENYPESLKKITDPPKILYYIGVLPKKDELCFGIVGTRRPTSYGQQATIEITNDLINSGVIIVSGMAPGIDTLTHRLCVEKKKRTIAVLGTGLDEESIYPQENLGLSRQIIENDGCLISELPPKTHGSVYSFPKRNRIISGLSKGVLVVEAKERSGSLITAKYAQKQGKKLFAVPGQIFTLNAKGTNKLIKEGATLVQNADDILREFCLTSQAKQSEKNKFVVQSDEEGLILGTLKEGALHIDKIIEKTNLSPSIIITTLALMEISDKVRNLGSNIYSL